MSVGVSFELLYGDDKITALSIFLQWTDNLVGSLDIGDVHIDDQQAFWLQPALLALDLATDSVRLASTHWHRCRISSRLSVMVRLRTMAASTEYSKGRDLPHLWSPPNAA